MRDRLSAGVPRGALLLCAIAITSGAACGSDAGSDPRRSGAQPMSPTGNHAPGSMTSGSGSDAFGNSNEMIPAGSGMSSGGSQMMQPELCAQGDANASPVTPTVWLVIDGSGSMNEDFGNSSRWEALRSALMDDGGVVKDLEHVVRFGMVIYNGPEDDGGGQGQCNAPDKVNLLCGCLTGYERACCSQACGGTPPPPPADPAMCANLVTVDPALDNFMTLDAAYPTREIGGWTPTDRAMEHVVANLPVLNQAVLDEQKDPIYVILATDGQPNDNCNGMGNGQDFQPEVAQRVLDAVNNGVKMGMSLFVISLAGDDDQLRMHLEDVAAAGNTGKPPFEPSSKDELANTLREVVGGASCSVTLNGEVQMGQECTGQVTLNGNVLECGSDNGWRMQDPRTVQITGSACDMFLAMQSQIHAAFPCGVFVPD
jgi:hypothetical protein